VTDSDIVFMPEQATAIVGAGPAGLVSARWLKQYGFEPVLFESAEQLGGQWNRASPMSGTWSGMRTNTSRFLSVFSDLDHESGTALYPSQAAMLAYLHRYAEDFDLVRHIRLNTPVAQLSRHNSGGWRVDSIRDGVASAEVFQRVIIASGRHVEADVPKVPGLDGFTGGLGAVHTSQYNGPDRYRDKNVVVAGCSISALEIASDIALFGARSVTASYRRQRYVLPKIIAGVPTDHLMFTRQAALAAESVPLESLAQGLKDMVLRFAGSPDQFGARQPDPNIFVAGISQSQHFLPLVAEGRITTRPWIARIDGRSVHFSDGTTADADAILFGTGYRLSLRWLSQAIRDTLDLDEQHLDLHHHTFHPDLPGLAFIGLFDQTGPYLPVLELQARWVAYALAGLVAVPTRGAMIEGVARYRERRHQPQNVLMHAMALLFARNAHVEPDLAQWPTLARELLSGPLTPVSFRLNGPDRLSNASQSLAA
jgi:dimethylaniline monooxygenase (N-oxide forming)